MRTAPFMLQTATIVAHAENNCALNPTSTLTGLRREGERNLSLVTLANKLLDHDSKLKFQHHAP